MVIVGRGVGRWRWSEGRGGAAALHGAFHCGKELGVIHRLEQIVDGVDADAFDGVVFVGGDKDHHGIARNQFHKLHTRQFGHLNVEKKQVDFARNNQGIGLAGRGEHSGKLQRGCAAGIIADKLARQGFIVDYNAF